jgi:FixJ family two-component response regulator
MEKRYIVNLTVEEREVLTQLVKRDRVSGLKRQRAGVLLKADDGLTDEEIADQLDVSLSTVQASEAQLARIACSPAPPGRARWTVSLLADKLIELNVFETVSASTVQRGLRKMKSSLGL